MENIEDHITDAHPSEAFRFEVQQDMVAYLDGMMECPACHGAFTWMSGFVSHLETAHGLSDLVSFLAEKFPTDETKSTPAVIDGVPKSLFGESLPKLEDVIARDAGGGDNGSDEDVWTTNEQGREEGTRKRARTETIASSRQNGNEAGVGSVCVERSNSNGRSVLLFHCDVCAFTSNDFDQYTAHTNLHVGEGKGVSPGAGSIIRKLLTGTVRAKTSHTSTPTMVENMSDSEVSFETHSSVSSPALNLSAAAGDMSRIAVLSGGRKRAVMQNCHLCPFQTNKTVHFRRHLEIHERNESITDGYSCGYCHFLHPRLNCIKFHLGMSDLIKFHLGMSDLIKFHLGKSDLIKFHLVMSDMIKFHLGMSDLIKFHLGMSSLDMFLMWYV